MMYEIKLGDFVAQSHPAEAFLLKKGIVIESLKGSFVVQWLTYNKEFYMDSEDEVFGKKMIKGKILISPAMIKGRGDIFLWAPVKKTVIKVSRGTSVYVASYDMDERDRILVYDGFNLLAIHPDELEEIGFN